METLALIGLSTMVVSSGFLAVLMVCSELRTSTRVLSACLIGTMCLGLWIG